MNNDKQTAEIHDETLETEKPALKLSREVVGVIAARTGIKAGMMNPTRKSASSSACGGPIQPI